MFKTILSYLPLFHDHGIIDGQVILTKKWGAIPYRTRDIPSGPAPKVILHKGDIFVDTGKYDDASFRIYEKDLDVHKHSSSSGE